MLLYNHLELMNIQAEVLYVHDRASFGSPGGFPLGSIDRS